MIQVDTHYCFSSNFVPDCSSSELSINPVELELHNRRAHTLVAAVSVSPTSDVSVKWVRIEDKGWKNSNWNIL